MVNRVLKINDKIANDVIENRKIRGLFYTELENGKIIGIDNRDGNAWVKEFDNITSCIAWLHDEDETFIIRSDEGFWNNKEGWVSELEQADKFESKDFNLPVGDNVHWVCFEDFPVKQEVKEMVLSIIRKRYPNLSKKEAFMLPQNMVGTSLKDMENMTRKEVEDEIYYALLVYSDAPNIKYELCCCKHGCWLCDSNIRGLSI